MQVSFAAEGWDEVTFTPVVLNSEGVEGPMFFETRGYPEVAVGERGQDILRRLIDLSSIYGTMVELGDGRATLRIGDQE